MKLLKKKDNPKKMNNKSDNPTNEELEVKAPTFWDVMAPEGMKIDSEDHGIIKQTLGSNTYFRPFYIPRDGYPRKLQTNWLYPIISSGEVDLLIDCQKTSKSQAVRMLQNQITMLESNLAFQKKRGNIDQIHDIETKIIDTNQLMAEIQFSENDSFNVSVMGNIFAQSKKELDLFSERVEDEMKGIFVKISSTWSRVKSGFRSSLPLGNVELKDTYRNLDRRALSTFSPFISGSGRFLGGVPIGINKITGQKEFINSFGNEDFRPQNYNVGILGVSGSGKSLAMKLKIARELSGANIYASIIDVEGEFVKITKRLGGVNLNLSEESNIIINPCAFNYTEIELEENDEELDSLLDSDERKIETREGKTFIQFVPIREKVSEIIAFFDIIVRGKDQEDSGLTVFERNYLEEAINHIINQLGITTHPDSLYENKPIEVDGQLIQSKVRKKEPELIQIYEYIVKKFKDTEENDRVIRLIAAIKPFLRTGSKPIFDGQTFLGKGVSQSLMSQRLINFNIAELEEGFLRPIAYHVILNFLWEYFAKSPENKTKKKYIYADEMWMFLDSEQTCSFLEKLARRARKRNCGLCYASQDFVRILENPKSRGILSSTFTFLFFKQNKIDLAKTKENFDLSQGELDILFGNADKGEGIMRVGGSSVWFQTDPSQEEMMFIESNAAVLEEMKKRKNRN